MRRRFGLVFFLLLYGSIIAVTHFYLALRLVLLPAVPSPYAEVLVATISVFGVALFLRPLADRYLPRRILNATALPVLAWMGVGFLLLICQIGSDVALSLAARAAWAMGEPPLGSSDRAQAAFVAATALGLSAWAIVLCLSGPALKRLEVRISRWPRRLDGFRIVQLSDVHIGPILDRRFAARVARSVNALEPDLVAITGDLVDGRVDHVGAEVEPLRALAARHGTFFVTGNHDYFSRADPWVEKLREFGWRVLRNERVTISSDGAAFDLAGVDDRMARHFGGDQGEDLGRAVEGRDEERPIVLLAHNPNVFDEAVERGIDLQLSGHTHGGQIWPFQAMVRLATRYLAGIYRRGRSTLYVSRGTGFWGPPMRLFRRAEITEITVRGDHP